MGGIEEQQDGRKVKKDVLAVNSLPAADDLLYTTVVWKRWRLDLMEQICIA